MTTFANYAGIVPPKMAVVVVYRLEPIFTGGGGSGPVTPVPVGQKLAGGTVGAAYSETISAQGGSGSGYVYALASGALPTGTSLNTSTGVISGTTSAAGTFSFLIGVMDSLGNIGSQAFQIVVTTPTASNSGFVA